MGAKENPRRSNGEEEEARPFTTPPFLNPSIPTTGTPSSGAIVSSHKNCVLLGDWWLARAEGECGTKRLSVVGFASRKHAIRIFTSAPIVKRCNAYTLETADGVTVIIQGMVNKDRMHENGFPPEVCNHFLIGFPYNWDYYADEYFSKNLNPTRSPARFSGASELVGGFVDCLKKLFDLTSGNSTFQSSSRLPKETQILGGGLEVNIGCFNDDIDNRRKVAPLVGHDFEGHAVDDSEVVSDRDDVCAGTRSTLQEECSLTHVGGQKDCHLVNSGLVDNGVIHQMPHFVEGSSNAENSVNPAESGSENIFVKSSPKDADTSHHKLGQELRNFALQREYQDKKSRVANTHNSGTPLEQKDPESFDATPVNARGDVAKPTLSSDAKESLKGSIRMEGVRTRSQILLLAKEDVSSSFSIRQENYCHHVEGELSSFKSTKMKHFPKQAVHSEVLEVEEKSRDQASHAMGRRTKRSSSYVQSPLTRHKAMQLSIASPESLNLKRSRSGRVIVPALTKGYQQIIYDSDGSIIGISGADSLKSPNKGNKSEPAKKRKFL
ncbi:uncharacterized protein [Typha latifolia]|uniref:uncharacterized protein isoform X2 n=1 Tax=Typha latifolia TaxID=4733 RepID=UPI003C30D9C2